MSRPGCRHEVLARSPLCSLEYCPQCNILHLSLGALTLRLAPDALEAVWRVLGTGLEAFKARTRQQDHSDEASHSADWGLAHRRSLLS